MPAKRSGRSTREQGLERTDNDMDFTSWPQVGMINQKNYYTDYLKRDDQVLALRQQNEESRARMAKAARDKDRALAQSGQNGAVNGLDADGDVEDTTMGEDGTTASTDPDANGSKVIVIHPGSQNLRIGLASDALPKTIPMVVARRSTENEWEHEERKPKRRKLDNGEEPEDPKQTFDEDFQAQFATMTVDLKNRMRRKARRIVPNCREVAISHNRKSTPIVMPELNDTSRVDWTEVTPGEADAPPGHFVGHAALRIPDTSTPRYKLSWPLRFGYFNEEDYESKDEIVRDMSVILEDAIENQLGISRKRDRVQYGCVYVIPDLYERKYVSAILDLLLRELGFSRVCFIQESMAGSFGAGYATCVIVDVGAQKTSICCVDEGMCVESSRINLRYGGSDVTETFMRMMLTDSFPYSDINLRRRYDFLLGDELKHKFCTLSIMEFAQQQFEFYLRVAGQDTRQYYFRAYDEVILAPMGFYYPSIFDNSEKLRRRRTIVNRSYDLYDGSPNDQTSAAQAQVLAMAPQPEGVANSRALPSELVSNGQSAAKPAKGAASKLAATTAGKDTPQQTTPAPDDAELNGERVGTPQAGEKEQSAPQSDPITEMINSADIRDRTLPILPLGQAIALSIEQGSKGDERKLRDFVGGIIPIGGGAQTPMFRQFLEEELAETQTKFRKDIMVAPPPREIDAQVLVWKGASVFGKLKSTNDSWIGTMEYDRLGSMASSARSDRVYHQDYIARIRYSNVLPPPPNHPKLLNIPNTGLSSGHYTSAGYASRLAREQPLNIEADAELGMPIDLVGLPGVFEGDESCLNGLEHPPVHHPADRALLKPLSALGKGSSSTASVSFLRRTEYISTDQNRRSEHKVPGTPAGTRKRKRPEIENENDPARILQDVVAGFDVANPHDASSQDQDSGINNKRAWEKPEHPTNSSLQLVDSYPLLPDLDAVSNSFWNIIVKFSTNPGSSSNAYDSRLDAAILRPLPLPASVIEQHDLAQAAWNENPKGAAPPKPNYHYEFFLPEDSDEATDIKKRLNTKSAHRDKANRVNGAVDEEGQEDESRLFRYPRIRHYQTFQQSGDVENPFSDSVALALYDPSDDSKSHERGQAKQKAAYFYPVGQRTFVRARHIAPSTKVGGVDEDDKVDLLEVYTRSSTADDNMKRARIRDEKYYATASPPEVATEA
ncbi:MAG: actin-like protein arp8 [Chrysothrix sp. TS-e1954]|nr:MAG: actin-like protein arp8 [Chrysothrix sp. TS-e1954]